VSAAAPGSPPLPPPPASDGPKDLLAVGLGALGAGAGLGGGLITLLLFVVRALQGVEFRRYGVPVSDTSLDPLAGLVAAIAAAAFFGWRRSRPIENVFQRGVVCVLAAVGAIIVAFLAIPVWHFLRFIGLAVLCIASFTLGVTASRWSMHGGGYAGGARSGSA
jgi:hypothetical protein